MLKNSEFEYELIDCGDGYKIEKFGDLTIERPCPQGIWPAKLPEIKPEIYFEKKSPNGPWQGISGLNEKWNIKIGDIYAELKFSQNGQVGIFPEQFENWKWISEKIKDNSDRELKILNLFAYTGMSTLFSSHKNTEVCHVDGAKSSINWAKRNAAISELSDAKIRWICDDVIKFIGREIRRGKKYDGVILDPPAFGRGAKKDWRIERDLSDLMRMVQDLLTADPLFIVLTCHAPEFLPEDLAKLLEDLPPFTGKKAEKFVLEIPSKNGNSLPSSFGARISNEFPKS